MKATNILILILVILTFASCRNRSRIVTVTETKTVVVERIDTVLVFVGDSTRDVRPLTPKDLSLGFEHVVKNDLATVTIVFDAQTNEMTTDLVVHDREETVQAERTTETSTRERNVVRNVEVVRRPWWHTLLIGLGCFLAGFYVAMVRQSFTPTRIR